MVEINFEKDLRIDPDQLDIEWLRQSELYAKYSLTLEDAKKNVADIEEQLKAQVEELKRVRSELILEAHRDGIPGIDKVTDPKAEAYYRDHKKHKRAKDKWLQLGQDLADAKHEAGMCLVAVFAFNHRKQALEDLVRLHGQNYFAGPQEPRELGGEWTKKAEELSEERTTRRMREKRDKKQQTRRSK